jgi:hypothetical protein
MAKRRAPRGGNRVGAAASQRQEHVESRGDAKFIEDLLVLTRFSDRLGIDGLLRLVVPTPRP